MPDTSPLPDGLPGYAISPINERLDAVDGDDGRLWVRHHDKRVFRPLTASADMWRFKAARYRLHGWWCEAAEHLRCHDCLDAELSLDALNSAPDIDWGGDAA